MFNRLKGRKRDMEKLSATMTSALAIASGDGSEAAGAHHLLLAALALDDASGRQAFEHVGADPDGLKDAIEAALASGLAAIELPVVDADTSASSNGNMKVDATYDAAIKATYEFHNPARGGGGRLRAAHFVAGAASIEHGLAARALAEMGVDSAELVAAAVALAKES